jgi:hypothetical protein
MITFVTIPARFDMASYYEIDKEIYEPHYRNRSMAFMRISGMEEI